MRALLFVIAVCQMFVTSAQACSYTPLPLPEQVRLAERIVVVRFDGLDVGNRRVAAFRRQAAEHCAALAEVHAERQALRESNNAAEGDEATAFPENTELVLCRTEVKRSKQLYALRLEVVRTLKGSSDPVSATATLKDRSDCYLDPEPGDHYLLFLSGGRVHLSHSLYFGSVSGPDDPRVAEVLEAMRQLSELESAKPEE